MSDESLLTPKSFNKGEWSELYVFFRLLAEGKLFAADANLNRVQNIVYPILSIIREDIEGMIYKYRTADECGNIRIYLNDKEELALSVGEFQVQADSLLQQIREGSGSFQANYSTNKFIKKIFIPRTKFKAPSNNKEDIILELHDINTGYTPKVGFSIKSQLGSASTLLNAGKTTNFIYSVKDLSDNDITEINNINIIRKGEPHADIMKRIQTILEKGGIITFCEMQNTIFKNNLILIDSEMPKLIGDLLLLFYKPQPETHIKKLTAKLTQINPLNISNPLFYEYKLKELLSAVALGMKPATPWLGVDEANGGYIIVKKDGEVLTYHLYNRDAFKTYLIDNTKFETASTKRYDYGYLYEQNGETLLNLNLQIRFL